MEDVLKTIDTIEKLVLEGKRPMIGAGKIVDDAAILGMLNYLRNSLPEEINYSKMVTKNEEEIIQSAKDKASAIMQDTMNKVNLFLNEHELRKQAEIEAREIITKAQKYSNTLSEGVKNEILNIMTNVENNLDEMLERIITSKNALLNNFSKGSSE